MRFGNYIKEARTGTLGAAVKKSEKKRQAAIKKAMAFMKRTGSSAEEAAKEFDLLPGDVKKLNEEVDTSLEEARGTKLAKVQPGVGKPAVDEDGLKISDSVVISGNMVAVNVGSNTLSLFDNKTGKELFALNSKQVSLLKKAL